MAYDRDCLTETQKGAIAENLVANWLMTESNGRLSPFKPVADDGGIDLLVFDRKTRKTLLIQIKARTRTDAMTEKRRNPRFSIRFATFESSEDYYIVGVLLDKNLSIPEAIWLIPSEVAKEKGLRALKDKEGKAARLVLPCNPSNNSNDQWSDFKTYSPQNFVKLVELAFEARF